MTRKRTHTVINRSLLSDISRMIEDALGCGGHGEYRTDDSLLADRQADQRGNIER